MDVVGLPTVYDAQIVNSINKACSPTPQARILLVFIANEIPGN
jgi:hypothetical protein